MRVQWIEYKGKKILFEDFSKLHGDQMLEVLHQVRQEFQRINSPVRVLADFTDGLTNPDFVEELKKAMKEVDHLILKIASVGVTGVKKILAKGIAKFTDTSKKTKYFDTLEEAKEFLAE